LTPFFSVVIPTYNRKATLLRCLDALAAQTFDSANFEVIVSDDGSSDGSAEAVKDRSFPFACRVISSANGGASRARNVGAAVAVGSWIALTEDDVVPRTDWLSAAAARLMRPEAPDVLEGRTVQLETGGELRRFDVKRFLSFIPCNLFIQRAVWDRLGGYDPEFYDAKRHLYFREDADWGFRAIAAGCRVEIAREVIVAHPAQFLSFSDCLRHGRRYEFDALLYKKYPALYRRMIETKKIFGIPVRRPQYWLALLCAVAWVGVFVGLFVGHCLFIGATALMVLGTFLYRFKYQNWKAFRVDRVPETIGFIWAPFAYIGALVRGCWSFRTIGVLWP